MNATDRRSLDPTRRGMPISILALVTAAGLLLGAATTALAQTDEWAKELEKGAPSGETPSAERSSDASDEADAAENGDSNAGTASDRGNASESGNASGSTSKSGVTLSQEPFHYVAPLIDTSYSVGPAEFLGIDMPADPPGAKAVRLIGTIQVEGQGDIQVRLFRAADYQNWLKKRGGRKAEPYWTSKRLRTIHMDHPLTSGSPVVLVIDNGYSVRTPKKVKTLLQIQYERTGAVPAATVSSGTGRPAEDDFIVPRSDTEEVVPPPPPPPPSDSQAD
jgi:hypothetical protein